MKQYAYILLQYLFVVQVSITNAIETSRSRSRSLSLQQEDHLQEIDIPLLRRKMNNRNTQIGTAACQSDTDQLRTNLGLNNAYDAVMNDFTTSIQENAASYCTSVRSGDLVDTQCISNYTEFDATATYNTHCNTLGGRNYATSVLVRCDKFDGNYTLDMQLLNVPSCIGVSCDAGYLYLTLTHILDGVKESMGDGEGTDNPDVDAWDCTYYHSMGTLADAPATVITMEGNDKKKSAGSRIRPMNSIFIGVLATTAAMLVL